MDLAQITIRLQSLWQQVPQKRLTQVLMSLLVVYIAYWSANFTWALYPEGATKSSTAAIKSSTSTSSRQINTSAIRSLNLFGEYNKEQPVVKQTEKIESAPETRLKLTLTGLVASDDPTTAAAIIESKGKQETYGIDDKIEGTRAILKQVQNDRVIIQSSGRMETLMLDGFEYTQGNGREVVTTESDPKVVKTRTKTSLTNKNATDPEKSARIKERVAKARADILDNPGKLTDYIKVSPYRKDGKVKGYRLMPSKDPEFFAGVGLLPGDIAIQINGKDLTDMREAQKALIELRKAEHVDILVERNGELHDVSLGLNN
ncbi:type II secretion system protein GspC [Thalassotalea psychrophila]|uniref:Type II secretion system protein GspC n=1 Tax=Thalassotalea psychrophila TaxID=3065647 RepID=A0ABY9TUQ9_9GAMM|nr:type II secretion system protein GspC [Colwelliaceae bacterium SQ149]